jgi:hypothetical protein
MLFDILKYVTSGFWVFIGCFIILILFVNGMVNLVARLRGIPAYPSKCPRCGYDHDKTEDD